MAQSALERNPTLRTPTLYGHPVLADSLLCPRVKKARSYFFSKFNPRNTGGEGYRHTTVVPSRF